MKARKTYLGGMETSWTSPQVIVPLGLTTSLKLIYNNPRLKSVLSENENHAQWIQEVMACLDDFQCSEGKFFFEQQQRAGTLRILFQVALENSDDEELSEEALQLMLPVSLLLN